MNELSDLPSIQASPSTSDFTIGAALDSLRRSLGVEDGIVTGLGPCSHRISVLLQARLLNRGWRGALWYDVLISTHTGGVYHQSSRREATNGTCCSALPKELVLIWKELEGVILLPTPGMAATHNALASLVRYVMVWRVQ